MDLIIFCPTCKRFVGDKAQCPYCDWVRPAELSRVGQIQWQTRALTDEALPGMPAYPVQLTEANGLIFMPLDNGELVALDAATGRPVWQRRLRDDHKLRTHGVALWKDALLIGAENLSDLPTRDRALTAWRLSDGAEVWQWPTGGDSLSVPCVNESIVYFSSSEPRVYAFDLTTRQQRWSVPGLAWTPEAPGLFDQTLVVPARGPQAAAYSVVDGTRLWVAAVDDKETEWLNYSPVVTAETVYLSGWRNKLYAVDRLSGERRWVYSSERGITCGPVLSGDKLLVGVKDYREADGQRKTGYGLYALKTSTGEVVWKVRTDKHIYISPVIVDEVVLLASDDRRLRALNVNDGSELWQVTLPDKLRAGPLVIDDRVVVGQRDGTLHSIWWKVEPPVYPDPQELLDQHQPLEAAAVLALRGDHVGAARLFEQEKEFRSAAELWREAGKLAEAAKCYAKAGEFVPALELYRQTGDRPAEARVLTLQGKHAEAAAIYEALGKIDLAVAEYIVAERVAYAADLLQVAGRRTEAARLYQQAKQDDRAAELLIADGRHTEAANIYRNLNKPEAAIGVLLQGKLLIEAAELYEQIGQIRNAAELYEKAGQPARALSLYEQIQDWPHVAELAEGTGDYAHSALALSKIGQLSHAAELYERANQIDLALDLYESQGVWDKVDSLAGQTGQWARQAHALLKKGLMSQAGEAYQHAAEQANGNQQPAEEVAQLYEAAAQCYLEEENGAKHSECWKEVCQLRQWPYVHGQVRVTAPFFEGEYSLVEVLVQNDGADTARLIQVKSVSRKFELDMTETQGIRALSAGGNRKLMLSLRPKPNVAGRTRLRIKLAYTNPAQHDFEETLETQVEVRAHDEKLVELSHGTPPPITPGGLVYPRGGPVTAGPGVGEELPAGEEQGVPAARPPEIMNLYEHLPEHFDVEELQDLCFRLNIPYDDWPPMGRTGTARALITYCERHDMCPALIELCRQKRPNVEW